MADAVVFSLRQRCLATVDKHLGSKDNLGAVNNKDLLTISEKEQLNEYSSVFGVNSPI